MRHCQTAHGTGDLWNMLVLGARFLFPVNILTLVGEALNIFVETTAIFLICCFR